MLNAEGLATVSGIKFSDATGDGFSQDDTPLAGVTIELFRDNGDGVFDDSSDLLVDTAVTDDAGRYEFCPTPGRYFIREQVPPGAVQTGGPAFYTIDVIGDRVFTPGTFVDDFENPVPGSTFFINAFDPDPTLIKNSVPGVVGGERDVLIDVLGESNAISASGVVGFDGVGGFFIFATAAPGTLAVLQYDGADADIAGPPAELVNAQALSADLTAGGTQNGLRLDFVTLEAGLTETALEIEIRATSAGGGTATFTGEIPESVDPSIFFVGFGLFTTTGGFTFEDVTSLEFVFNPGGVPDVDFTLDGIVAVAEQNVGFDFANFQGQASLSGCVFVDVDNDGVRDEREAILRNVEIVLIGTDLAGNTVRRTTTTDAAGNFRFDNLPAGTYSLIQTQPPNFITGRLIPGNIGGTVGDNRFTNIVLAPGLVGTGFCFGERGLGPDFISKEQFFASTPPVSAFFIDAAYENILGRTGSLEEIFSWVDQVEAGKLSLSWVTDAFLHSTERRSNAINELYRQYLGRDADASGLEHWLGVWSATGKEENIEASIIGSAEFYASAGGTDAAWVQALYDSLLGRGASNADVAYWTGRLDQVSMRDVVLGFLFSDEYRLDAIAGWYRDYLGRDPDPASSLYWLGQLRQGASAESIELSLLLSDESRSRY